MQYSFIQIDSAACRSKLPVCGNFMRQIACYIYEANCMLYLCSIYTMYLGTILIACT